MAYSILSQAVGEIQNCVSGLFSKQSDES